MVRDQVLQVFGPLCKDPDNMLLLHQFDELLPLLFFLYNTVFRGGDLDQWLAVLLQISLMFIIFRRRNYDTTKPHYASYHTSFITSKKMQKLLLQCESFCKF